MPDLEESDVDSDDDESLSSAPDFDPGGDDRGDFWSHEEIPEKSEAPTEAESLPVLPHPPPSPIIAPPDSPSPPQAPEEAREEVENDGLGRSADGKSRLIRAKANCTYGKKQVPPGGGELSMFRKLVLREVIIVNELHRSADKPMS